MKAFLFLALFVLATVSYANASPFVSSEDDPLMHNDDLNWGNADESFQGRGRLLLPVKIKEVVLPAIKVTQALKEMAKIHQ